MASNSLPRSRLDTFQPISASAVHVLARLAARKAVKEQLRDAGVRVTLVPTRDITMQANEYLALHPELFDEARECAARLGLYEKPKRRRRQAKEAGFIKVDPAANVRGEAPVAKSRLREFIAGVIALRKTGDQQR